jgi:hypothetical protein
MVPFDVGPIYCETLSARAGVFPIEPMNTISNGVIVLFGLAGLYVVAKRAPRAYDLYVLSSIQIVTGIGSGLWHGLRNPDALFFEASSGLFFLFVFMFCWARRLWSYLGAAAFLAAFYAGFLLSRPYWGIVQRWVALAPIVILASLALIAQTYSYSKRVAAYGGVALLSAVVALLFRSYDLAACPYIPFGTHFLWHSFLSAAGFIGILAMTDLKSAKPVDRPSRPAEEAAE